MKKIIQLLEKIGAENTTLSDAEILELIEQNQLSDELSKAFISRDHKAITELLAGSTNICGILLPSENDDEDDSDDNSEEIAA